VNHMRRTYVRVLVANLASLVCLWWLQRAFL
jgi:hypothetical protein